MPQIINTRMCSLNTPRHFDTTRNTLSTALARLSSGKHINMPVMEFLGADC